MGFVVGARRGTQRANIVRSRLDSFSTPGLLVVLERQQVLRDAVGVERFERFFDHGLRVFVVDEAGRDVGQRFVRV